VATCGNYGAAISLATSLAGLKCVVYIPQAFHASRVAEIEARGTQIRRVPGDYENAVMASRQAALDEDLYDANPGGANTVLQLKAYGEIAYEIYDELRDAPRVVAVPVSNGTTLAGIYRGFLSLYRRGKTSRIPQMFAGSSFRKNPIIKAFFENSSDCTDLEPTRIRETRVNEPLVNWHAEDGAIALEAIRESNGWAGQASDRRMVSVARLVQKQEGLSVLPASTAGLISLLDRHRQDPLQGDRYVAVLTGRK
jgi:threonine synthase